MDIQTQNKTTRRTFWAVFAFYLLIAFEFLYMASPFAVYFYAAYRPGLTLLASLPAVAWSSTFFLPHIVVETSSPWIDAHNVIGAIMFLVGLLAFAACAGQVYYHKLTRRAEVTGGLYRYIRHPQYAAFILSSFGMLILWPRFLALILFVTMVFVYYFLARLEERECEEKFGRSYIDYKERTGMFLPAKLNLPTGLPSLPRAGLPRVLAIVVLYAASLSIAILLGYGIKRWALNSLYAAYSPGAAYISIAEMEPATLERIAAIACSSDEVQRRLALAGPQARFINYVAPTEWFVSEIPMNDGRGHILPQDYDRNQYKVIFTLAQIPAGRLAEGQQILLWAVHKTPVVEVWVDLSGGKVSKILAAPETVQYDGLPVPIY
ncbi:MAG: methyltransferase family protein [Chloroflexota bacterium]